MHHKFFLSNRTQWCYSAAGMVEEVLENRLRELVRDRLVRGEAPACARAAGHDHASWLSKWLSGNVGASIDEIAAVLSYVGLDLGRTITSADAARLDWQLLGVAGRLNDAQKKILLDLGEQLARGLVQQIAVTQSPTGQAPRRPPPARRGRTR